MVKKIGPKTSHWHPRRSAKHGWATEGAHVLDEGCAINEPNWERIDGAKEQSDLIE